MPRPSSTADAQPRQRRLRRKAAFSLIEALIALSITALAGSVLLLSVDSSLESTTEAVRQTIAEGVAQQLLDEMLTKHYTDVGFDPLAGILGASAWELLGNGIERFDDVDDFLGYVAQPAEGVFGEALGTGDDSGGLRPPSFRLRDDYFQNWRQRVDVYFVEANDHTVRSNTATAYRAIEVNVEWLKPNGAVIPLAKRKRVITSVPAST